MRLSTNDEKGSTTVPPTTIVEEGGPPELPGQTHQTIAGRHQEPDGDATAIPADHITNRWQRYANTAVQFLGAEARGIERIDESLRTAKVSLGEYYNMASIWFSVNLTANILTIGVLGPTTFQLGSLDSMLCCFFGTILGSAAACYMATYGPMSGCRSLVVARYTMGWYATRLCVVLAVVVILGYGLVDAITTGLIFAAVSGGSVSSVVGIVIFGFMVWIVTIFGIKYLHYYERYASVPQVCVLFVLIGVAAPSMDVQMTSQLTGSILIGARISYLFVCASGPLGWAPFIADSFAYYPASTSRWGVFSMTFLGFVASKTFVEFIGIGLGTGLATQASWAAGFAQFGVGGLIVAAFAPLGVFGKFCAVVMGLGIAANMVPGNYSAAFCAQLLSRRAERLPRVFWNTAATIIFIAVSIPGRDRLLTIFSNFLPLIGYWTTMWIVMTAEEEWLFRRRIRTSTHDPAVPYDWSAWSDPKRLPLGLAASVAFLVGWSGAILCMNQVYYTGPIAKMAGGADLGLPVGAAWAGLIYPPLRYLEWKRIGR